jgi:hypothetical protein
MQAVEFKTTVKNGVITIPSQFINSIAANVRVILLSEQAETAAPVKQKKNLHYIGIEMKDYTFNREEANERR